MIWLTWRQFRAAAAMMSAALAVLALILITTGPGLADDYATGIAACTRQSGGCSGFVDRFFQDHQNAFLAVTAVLLLLPALIGLFWGAPLIAREFEVGTHRLIWTQSVTRARWLIVKLGLTGLAAVAVAGLGSLVVGWWSSPIDKTATNYARMQPLLFDARGIAPIAYAVFAFALGVTVGMLARRTVPAMAITLAVFVGTQIAMAQLVRPHLVAPARTTVEISVANLDFIGRPVGDGAMRVGLKAPEGGRFTGAWVLSSQAVDASGRAVETIRLSRSGPCGPPQGAQARQPVSAKPGDELAPCFAEIKRLGYRQRVTYQPADRFWPIQWLETGIYTALACALAGFCSWRLRHRLA
jgi:ABC-type transport system involved in multi-copper enzyme maturation permease subunit